MRLRESDVTPEVVFRSRRAILLGGGMVALGAAASACGSGGEPRPATATPGTTTAVVDERGDPLTDHEAVTGYNNFYEFSTDKREVAEKAVGFKTKPWMLTVGGLVARPRTYDVTELGARFGEEERIYRLRCVEGWSMVIPWLGFPLAKLVKEAEPLGDAKYVRFEALLDPAKLPGQNFSFYRWPYVEGLRLDEALHPLTLLSLGVYGSSLPPQNGAPLRLVVPWKYGFKSIKSIVKVELVREPPTSLWMAAAPDEYGFFANVNPSVAHPRWSQASERRIGETGRRPTLPFNGYAEQVAGLYAGMDLAKNY